MSDFKVAFDDFRAGVQRQRLCFALATEDLKDRYRRSILGVAWIAISFFAFIGVKAAIFSQLNIGKTDDFLLYLTVGFALWTLISTLIVGSSTCFVSCRGWIMTSNLPYFIYILQFLYRSFFDFFLIALAAAIFCVFATSIDPAGSPYLLGALVLYFITGFGLVMCLAPIGARYRDVVYAIQTIMRVAFFATPIIWVPVPGTSMQTIANWNPLTHYIQIARAPLMGEPFPLHSAMIASLMTAIIFVAGVVVFSKAKRRVPLWL